MRALISSKDPHSLTDLNDQLEAGGFEVVSSESGLDTLNKLTQDDDIRLAILDTELPALGGIEICRAVRAQTGGKMVYVILLTGRSDKDNVVEGFAAGADDCMTKPFSFDELRARIKAGERVIKLEISLRQQIQQLQSANQQLAQLQGLIPICAWCKKIRDDSAYWQEIDDYLNQHCDTAFTHSICPSCMNKKFSEILDV